MGSEMCIRDSTIWRLNNRELRGQKDAKAVVIMIGTNNTGHTKQDPRETADGIEQVLSVLRARCPKAKVLLLGVFPRGQRPDSEMRKINIEINKHLAKMDDGNRVHFLDISDQFINEDGIIEKEMMPDFLHLSPKSYEIWAKAIEPKLKEFGL